MNRKLWLIIGLLLMLISCQPTTQVTQNQKVSNDGTQTNEIGTEDEVTHVIRTAERISMEDGSTMYQMLKTSRRKNRPIFMIFYSEWCTTCSWVERDIVGASNPISFLKSNFVSFRINGEHGEGLDVANHLDIREYPTIVYISTEGNEIERYLGMPNEHKIIQLGKRVLKEEKDIKKRKAKKARRKK